MEHHLSWLIIHFGYAGIFLALALGIVGLPIPDEILLTYIGYNVFQGNLHFLLSLLSACAGASTGITLSYFIGNKLGLPFLRKVGPKLHITDKRIERTNRLFQTFPLFAACRILHSWCQASDSLYGGNVVHEIPQICPIFLLRSLYLEHYISLVGLWTGRKVVSDQGVHPSLWTIRLFPFGSDCYNGVGHFKVETDQANPR